MVEATAVVDVMSVQPTSEKRTVLQLSGSAAVATPIVVSSPAVIAVICFSIVMFPLLRFCMHCETHVKRPERRLTKVRRP